MEMKTPKKISMKDIALFSTFKSKPLAKQQTSNGLYSQEKEILLIINVDIGKNEENKIFYHRDDNPSKLAEEFCKSNDLHMNLKNILQKNIEEKVEEYNKNQNNLNFSKSKDENENIDQNHSSNQRIINSEIIQSAKKTISKNLYNFPKYMSETKPGYIHLLIFFIFFILKYF